MDFCRATTIATEGPATFGTVVVSTQFPKRSHQMKPSFWYSHLLLGMKMIMMRECSKCLKATHGRQTVQMEKVQMVILWKHGFYKKPWWNCLSPPANSAHGEGIVVRSDYSRLVCEDHLHQEKDQGAALRNRDLKSKERGGHVCYFLCHSCDSFWIIQVPSLFIRFLWEEHFIVHLAWVDHPEKDKYDLTLTVLI